MTKIDPLNIKRAKIVARHYGITVKEALSKMWSKSGQVSRKNFLHRRGKRGH